MQGDRASGSGHGGGPDGGLADAVPSLRVKACSPAAPLLRDATAHPPDRTREVGRPVDISRTSAEAGLGEIEPPTPAFPTSPSERSERPGEVTAARRPWVRVCPAASHRPLHNATPHAGHSTSRCGAGMGPRGPADAEADGGSPRCDPSPASAPQRRPALPVVPQGGTGRGERWRPPTSPSERSERPGEVTAARRPWVRVCPAVNHRPLHKAPPHAGHGTSRCGAGMGPRGPANDEAGGGSPRCDPSPASAPQGRPALPDAPAGLGEVGRRTASNPHLTTPSSRIPRSLCRS